MRGIEVLKRQMKDPQMLEALGGISDTIAAGGTFSEALTIYPKIFDNLYINMVKAGEAGGVLEVVLGRLAEFAEKSEKIKNKVKGAMIYPIVVLFAAIGITAFLLIAVIPKFKQVFADMLGGQELPAVTQFVINASEWVQHNYITIAIGVVVLVVLKKIIGKTDKGGISCVNPGSVSLPKNNNPKTYAIYEGASIEIKTFGGKIIEKYNF